MAGTNRKSKRINLERDGLAIKAEYLQTDPWAIIAILRCEVLSRLVIDPCTGDGRMAVAAAEAGAKVIAFDKYDWDKGFHHKRLKYVYSADFLIRASWSGHIDSATRNDDATYFMNPPFSKACEFVDKAMELGARKIICFQRSVWRESSRRREWWDKNPPNRIYQCGNRADCWYGTIPEDEREGGANQPHSWYVWERGQPPGTLMGTIWKDKK